jgi:hypothetical protein
MKKALPPLILLILGCVSVQAARPTNTGIFTGTWKSQIWHHNHVPIQALLSEDSAGNLTGTLQYGQPCNVTIPINVHVNGGYLYIQYGNNNGWILGNMEAGNTSIGGNTRYAPCGIYQTFTLYKQ